MAYSRHTGCRRHRAVDITLAVGLLAVFPAFVVFLWCIGWYADMGGDHALAGARHGAVSTIERDPNVVYVAAMPFGLKAQPFVVTKDTLVLVGRKEGGFDDLAPGVRVRVDFDVRDGVRRALCVQLLRADVTERECLRPAPSEQARDAAPATGATAVRSDEPRARPASPPEKPL
jgi:hypothetical protein